MVVRDDLIEDLVLLIQATQWPNDKSNSTLARNGANRVPKPPRTPQTTPTSLHRPVINSEPPLRTDFSTTHRSPSDDFDDEAGNEKKNSSCFGLESFITNIEPPFNIEPQFNLEIQAQYDQISPSLTGALNYQANYAFSKSISSHGGSRYLPSARYQSNSKLGHTANSTLGDSGLISNMSTSQTSSTALVPGSPSEQHSSPPPLKRQLSTETQEVVLLLLSEVFELNEEQLQQFVTAAYRRKSADVSLEITIETIGQDNTVHGSLRLMGGRGGGHDRDLRAPLPVTYTTHMPVDNLWSQQLLVRFSRDRKVMVETNNKANKKLKVKKPKKTKESEDSSETSTLRKTKTESALGSPTKPVSVQDLATSETCSPLLPDRADTSTPEPSVLLADESSHSKNSKLAKATLQRGLKGIRHSLRKKKKKPKDAQADDGEISRDDPTAMKSLDGIPIENVGTPKRESEVEVKLVEKSSKSPFKRFGSLRAGKSDSPFRRLNMLRGSLRKTGSGHKVNVSNQAHMIDDKPFIVSKDELVTTSAKPLNRSHPNNPFGDFKDNSDDDLDSTNPFISTKDSTSELDATNPFHDESAEHGSRLSADPLSFDNKSRSKGLRKSIRKTFNRIKGKKGHKGEKSAEEIPLNSPREQNVGESKEELKNRINSGEISPVKAKPVIDSLPPKTERPHFHLESKVEPLKVEPKIDSPAKYEVITEELAYKLIALQDATSSTSLEETLPLVDGLRAVLTIKLAITFQTKCQPFDIYRTTYQALYRKRFREMVPMKLPLEGVDCSATVDGEILLKQVSVFCPMSPLRVALARFLVLVEAATGKMGTPNTISARSPQKKSVAPQQPPESSATHVVEVHQAAAATSNPKESSGGSSPVGASKGKKKSPSKSPTKDRSSTTPPNGKSGSGSSTPSDKSRLSTSSTEEPADEFVYNQEAETILINPSDLLIQWERVSQGLTQGIYTRSETTEALVGGVSLVRWMVGHHLERLQTVFPVAGSAVTSKNLADTLRYLHLAESCAPLREYFEAETAEIGLGGVRDHVLGAVRKYTQLWVAALIRETTQRIDDAMKEQETAQPAPRTQRPTSQGSGEDKCRAVSLDRLLDEAGKMPFSASGVAEAMPALVTSLVRTVKQFENNKQIVYLAEMVEKRLGTYRPPGHGGLSNVAMPMIGYQREGSTEPADDDEIAEIVLRLVVVGRLMPVIVDFLDVAKNFYDPIFRKNYQLPFLEECWQVLVDGALALWRQIGAAGSLRVSLVEPPLKPDLLPQAISAVWSLCYSFSKINKLSDSRRTDKTQYSSCMDDCVMCWLQLIGQSSKLQLQRDIKQVAGAGETQTDHLMEITNGTRVLIKLVVDKTEELVWPGPDRPPEVLTFLGYQLTVLLDTFWRMLYLDHKDPSKKPNVISYWSCRIMDSLCDLRDQVADALERLDPSGEAVDQALTSLQLLPQKAAQLMCMQELSHVEEWVSRAASGGGGGALVRLLDGALQELYDCLAPAQPLVACLRDRLLDATAKHLDDVTQEEEFNQLAAVLVALRQFFTSNILLEEALQAAESRWEQQMADAQERGRPLAELQHSYYSLRLQEQELQQLEEQNANNSLLINVVFIENYGLTVSIVQAPSAVSIVKAASASYAATTNNNTLPEATVPPPAGGASRVAQKSTGMFSNMFKGASGVGGVYVEAQLVPAEWFPGASHDYKTALCKDDPAVIDEEINFPHVSKTSNGVERGGFLLLRLKLTRRLRSQTVGETLVPLDSIPRVAMEDRRTVRHSQLAVSKASPLHTYEPLNILRRRNDETACQFLAQLEQDNKGQQKAALRGSNTSLSNMW